VRVNCCIGLDRDPAIGLFQIIVGINEYLKRS
jgi:hypothetical protein